MWERFLYIASSYRHEIFDKKEFAFYNSYDISFMLYKNAIKKTKHKCSRNIDEYLKSFNNLIEHSEDTSLDYINSSLKRSVIFNYELSICIFENIKPSNNREHDKVKCRYTVYSKDFIFMALKTLAVMDKDLEIIDIINYLEKRY